jgi:uncharacterized protein (TIGR02246 family)
MRMVAHSAFAAALALSVSMPAHAQDDPNIEDLRSRYEAAFNGGDASQLAGLFAEDAVIMPPNVDAVEGRSAIEQHYGTVFGQAAPSGLSIDTRETRQLGDAMLDIGTFSFTATSPDGQTGPVTGDYLVVIERGDGDQWLITRHIWNEDMPQAPQ